MADFKTTLHETLHEILPIEGFLRNKIKIILNDYCYNDVRVILIPSFPGKYNDQTKKKQGLGKVREIMKKMKQNITQPLYHYCSTSLGVSTEEFAK